MRARNSGVSILKTLALLSLLVMQGSCSVEAQPGPQPESAESGREDARQSLLEFSRAIEKSVSRGDVDGLMLSVPETGIYFVDGLFSREEVHRLLLDKTSWLYRYMFSGDESVSRKLASMGKTETEIEVIKRGEDAWMVRYSAKGSPDLVENCVIRRDGVWYFDGMFYCE